MDVVHDSRNYTLVRMGTARELGKLVLIHKKSGPLGLILGDFI